ncbi:hypothetical protein Ddc_20340 [Ditylenchus destructor]|nr:hypothetical protein Ddc_20340 [Ditylenchus destructor]
MTAASFVTSHQTREQFCWKGVTGRGVVLERHGEVLEIKAAVGRSRQDGSRPIGDRRGCCWRSMQGSLPATGRAPPG